MPETLQGSSQPTLATTAQTPGTTPNSGDSIVALPLLSEQKGPISLTLTIDKSVGKVAAWVVGVMVVAILLSISAVVIALSARDRADHTDFGDDVGDAVAHVGVDDHLVSRNGA